MRIALCQIPVSSDPVVNLSRARDALLEAAEGGAELAVFPEATMVRFGSDLRAAAEPLDGPFCAGLAASCASARVAAVAGVFEPSPDGLSLIHISEPTRLGMISYAVFCLK